MKRIVVDCLNHDAFHDDQAMAGRGFGSTPRPSTDLKCSLFS